MRRWLFGGLSGVLTAVSIAAAAFAAVNFRGPTSEDLVREMAVIDRELALAERNLAAYRDKPLIAEQVTLRIVVLETTRAMLDQKRLSWLRGLKLIYRVDGWEVMPSREALAALQAQLADAEAGRLTARRWAASSTNDVTRNMALALEQVHLLTDAAIRQQIALAGLGLALPPPAAETAEAPLAAETAATAPPVELSRRERGIAGVLNRPASVR